MRIREAARLLDYDAETLRGLELRGVLPPIPRDHNGHRHFTAEDVERWRAVLLTPGGRPRGDKQKAAAKTPAGRGGRR